MNTATVVTDTEMLRVHARDLQYIGDAVESGAFALGDSIEDEHWANNLGMALADGGIRPAIETFVTEFRRAHYESRARILELGEVYQAAAMGLRCVADNYDDADR